jgi:hypothetical protein
LDGSNPDSKLLLLLGLKLLGLLVKLLARKIIKEVKKQIKINLFIRPRREFLIGN